MIAISASDVVNAFSYCAESGVLSWRDTGEEAGYLDRTSGYRRLEFKGRGHRVHRLAWVFITGSFPVDLIDHVNGNRSDNRACNLREATRSQNAANARVNRNNKHGLKGVFFAARERRFYSQFKLNGQSRRFGPFATAHEAYRAYCNAAVRAHGSYAHPSVASCAEASA